MVQPAHYRHDFFEAFSLTPEIDESRLRSIVNDLDGKANPNLDELRRTVVKRASVGNLRELEVAVSEKTDYVAPEVLKAYREAIGKKWDDEGKHNGPVIIVDGELKVPLRVRQGGYYDYAATARLNDVPATLLPVVYPAGKTVRDILIDNGVNLEERARYFGFAHLMWPSEGNEFLLVQRAKGMGIAADCVSTPGSTPDVILNKPGFKHGWGIQNYWAYHFTEEMRDEFKLKYGDFWTGRIDLFEDANAIPFGAIEIMTQLPVSEIAKQAYGDPRVLKEHTILYSIDPKSIPTFLQRIPTFYSVVAAISDMNSPSQ